MPIGQDHGLDSHGCLLDTVVGVSRLAWNFSIWACQLKNELHMPDVRCLAQAVSDANQAHQLPMYTSTGTTPRLHDVGRRSRRSTARNELRTPADRRAVRSQMRLTSANAAK